MRKGKYRRLHGKMTILSISMIVSLSAMGIGYAAWNDGFKMDMRITTGYAETKTNISRGQFDIEDADNLDIYVGENKVKVFGKVYPTFNHNLDIEIIDTGSVPVVFKEVKEHKNDKQVADLSKKNSYQFKSFNAGKGSNRSINSTTNLSTNEVRETFSLSINPDAKESKKELISSGMLRSFSTLGLDYSSGKDNEIQRLQDEINSIQSQIDSLQKELQDYISIDEEYQFNYDLKFEQDL